MVKRARRSAIVAITAFFVCVIVACLCCFAAIPGTTASGEPTETERVLTLDQLSDFNTETTEDGKQIIPNGKMAFDILIDVYSGDMVMNSVEDWFVPENAYDFRAVAAENNIDVDDFRDPEDLLYEDSDGNESSLFPIGYFIAPVVKNGFSESALRKLTGSDETATYNEMMTAILTGTATYAYDKIIINIPAEITYIGDFAFSFGLVGMAGQTTVMGFGSQTYSIMTLFKSMLSALAGGEELPINVNPTDKLPTIKEFRAITSGRTQNITTGVGVLGSFGKQGIEIDKYNSQRIKSVDYIKLDLSGFAKLGYQFCSVSAYPGGLTMGDTLEYLGVNSLYYEEYNDNGEYDSYGRLLPVDTVINIPSSLKVICGEATYGIVLGLPEDLSTSKLEYIGGYAFQGYSRDQKAITGVHGDLKLPDTVTYIGDGAFQYAEITSVFIPESVAFIGKEVFKNCDKLETVSLYAQASELGDNVFQYTKINALYIPSIEQYARTDINKSSFYTNDKNELSSGNIYVEATDGDVTYNGKSYKLLTGKLEIPEGVTHIGNGVFWGYDKITEVVLPESVETIGQYAFCKAVGITAVTFPDKEEGGAVVGVKSALTTIGEAAFYGLFNLTEIVIPEGVTSIYCGKYNNRHTEDAFAGCSNLTVVYNLSALELTAGSEKNGSVALNAMFILDEYDGESLFKQVGDYTFIETEDGAELFSYNGAGGNITLPNDYKGERYGIYQYAFRDNDNITEITIADNTVTNIGAYAFYNCAAVKKITIGGGIGSIGAYAFSGCNAVKTVLITSGMNSLGEGAFMDCAALTEITLQNSTVTEIGAKAFQNCSALLAINIPDTVITVGSEAFSGCSSAEELYIGKRVEEIGYRAFAFTSSLREAAIPDNVQRLANSGSLGGMRDYDEVFANSGIRSVYIGSGIVTMNNTFARCVDLSEVKFSPNSKIQKMIGVFRKCDSLHKFAIPETVTEIGSLFAEANNMHEIRLTSNIDFVAYLNSSRYMDHGLFTIGCKTDGLTIYFPELTAANRATYGKNCVAAMLLTAYPTQAYDYAFSRQFLLNVNFVAPNKEAYDLINAEIFDVNATPGVVISKYNVPYYTEWFVNAYAKTYNGQWHCYQTINQTSSVSPSITNDVRAPQDRIYYLQDVAYEVRKADGTLLATTTETKLARSVTQEILDAKISGYYTVNNNGTVSGNWRYLQGADLRYVRKIDAVSGAVYYQIDEAYTLPSRVGAYKTTDNWVVGTYDSATKVNADLSKMLVNGDVTYVNVLAADAKIIVALPDRFETTYNGKAWTLPAEYKDIVEVVSINNAADDAVAAGTYTVKLKIAEAVADTYEFADGVEAEIELVVEKQPAELVWYWNGAVVEDGTVLQKTYDGKSISEQLSVALVVDGEEISRLNDIVFLRKKNGIATNSAAIEVGEWTLTVAQSYMDGALNGYEIQGEPTRSFRINPITITIDDAFVRTLVWTANGTNLKNSVVYIYSDGTCSNKEIAGKTLVEVREVLNGVADFIDDTVAVEIAGNDVRFTVEYTANTGKEKDRGYQAVATLIANANYAFVSGNVSIKGVTVSFIDNAVNIVKDWYIVSIDNKLVNSDGSDWTVDDRVFGSSAVIAMPTLQHGDSVTFALRLAVFGSDKIVTVDEIALDDLSDYLNSSLPAGDYVLTAKIGVNLDDGIVYPAYNQDYMFTVDAANIRFNLTKGSNGYADYTWNGTQTVEITPDKTLFFKEFTDLLKDGVSLTSVTPTGYWASGEASSLFGGYTVTYNLLRMYNETYYSENDNNLTKLISGGSTYTVYFQISAANHNGLTTIDSARYEYYFTVTAYVNIDIPSVSDAGLVYTGNKVQPTIEESNLYEVVWDTADNYISGGKHNVFFRLYDSVHYRWFGVEEDTVTVEFNIEKATNEWLRVPNIVDWQFETFDTEINRIRAVAKFLDADKSVVFSVTKADGTAVPGLDGFTVNDDGTVSDETLIKALNDLVYGAYKLNVTVAGTNNYTPLFHSVDFRIDKAGNSWADGEGDLVLPSWIVGNYDPDENPIIVNAAHGTVKIEIRDMDGNVYYSSLKPEENTLNTLKVGKYLLVAWVDETENFAALAERSFTIEVFDKVGMPWWGTLSITLGALIVAAVIILILWKKGVFQILTGKLVVAIRTRASVDATIASVRAAKKMEEGRKSVEEAKRRERIEQLKKKSEEARNMPAEERAAALEAKAIAQAEKAEKLRARSEAMKKRAERMRERNKQADDQPAENGEQTSAEETPTVEAPTVEEQTPETPIAEEAHVETPETESSNTDTPETAEPRSDTNDEAAATENTDTTTED